MNETDIETMKAENPALTEEQIGLVHAGQRRINSIWEITQASIAVVVVCATMIVGVWIGIGVPGREIPTVLSMAFGTVVGFYFSRTNHTSVGGVKTSYRGR